jgi:hypothetical protein
MVEMEMGGWVVLLLQIRVEIKNENCPFNTIHIKHNNNHEATRYFADKNG